jgi:hypothetical protein
MGNLQPGAPRGVPLFLLGFLLFLVGPVIYFIRFRMDHLDTPWYVPGLATVGALFMLVSACRREGILRKAALVLFVLLCGGEWFLVAIATKVPTYAGPAQTGRKLPTFTTMLADGKTFTNQDLENGSSSVLVFFRGRW